MGVEDGRKTSGAGAFSRRTDKRLVKQVNHKLYEYANLYLYKV